MADSPEIKPQEIIEALSNNPGGNPPPGTEDKLKGYLDLIIFLIENGGGAALAAEKAELAAALAGLQYQVGDVFTTTREGSPLTLLGYGEWLQLEGVLYGTITEPAGEETGGGKIAQSDLPNVTLNFSATTENAGDHTHSVSGSTSSLNNGVTQTEFRPKGIYVYHWLRTA